jgi:hypothetical protein
MGAPGFAVVRWSEGIFPWEEERGRVNTQEDETL